MMRLAGAFILVFTALLLFSATAVAATVVKLDLPQLVEHSDVIVVAQVTGTEASVEDDGRVYTTVSFETHDTIAGKPPAEFTMRHIGGRAGDVATHAPGIPGFTPKERVLLFLGHSGDRFALTGLAQGKFRVATGPDGETDFVIPQIRGQHLVPPDKAPPPRDGADLPDPEDFDPDSHEKVFGQAHSLESFRHQVERLLKADQGDQ